MPSVKAPTLALTTQKLEMSDKVLTKLNVSNEDIPDFAIAMRIIELQMNHVPLQDACAQMNISRYTVYEDRWQELLAKARRVHAIPVMEGVKTVANYVYSEWPAVIEELVNVAKNGKRDHEKVAAAELLYTMFILPTAQTAQDDTGELEYMRKPKNFNAMMPVQVNAGGTLIVNQGGDAT